MRNITLILCIAALAAANARAASITTPDDIESTVGIVIGPDNQASLQTWGGFGVHAGSAFNNNLATRPVGETLETDPQVYAPRFDGESFSTEEVVVRDNSWLATHDPATAFGSNFSSDDGGNLAWSYGRFIDPDGQMTLDMFRYSRSTTGSSTLLNDAIDTDGDYSYHGEGFVDSDARSVIGINYGDDGAPGGSGPDEDTYYTSGNGDQPVHEIQIRADSGFGFGADNNAPNSQDELDAIVASLDDELGSDGMEQVTVGFSIVDDGITVYEDQATFDFVSSQGSSAAVPTPTAFSAFLVMSGLGALRARRTRRGARI